MGEVSADPEHSVICTPTVTGRLAAGRMRVGYHAAIGAVVVVVSLWAGEVCRGSFRMAGEDVRGLISILTEIETSDRPWFAG